MKHLTRQGRRCHGPPSSESCTEEVSMDVHVCKPRKTPLLRKKHLEARLAFARGHLKQDPSFWSTILSSDETKLELFGHMDAEYVWRKKGEAYKPKNTAHRQSLWWKHNAVGMLLFQWHRELPRSSRSKESWERRITSGPLMKTWRNPLRNSSSATTGSTSRTMMRNIPPR